MRQSGGVDSEAKGNTRQVRNIMIEVVEPEWTDESSVGQG